MMSLCVFRPVLLTLTLLLCSESAAARHEFVEEGEHIILPCNDVKDEQRECDGTTWTLKNKQLITNGKISSNLPQTLSNRLRVTQKCGLQIQNVHPQDAGRYEQYDQSERGLSEARVYLSVVSLTKEEHEENTEFRCQVSPALSGVKTEWLFNGRNVNIEKLNTTDLQNGITVPVPKSHRVYKLTDRLTCKVSHQLDKKEFSFRSNKPVKTITKTTTTQAKNEEKDTRETPGWLWAVVAAVVGVLLLVLVTVVVVVTCRRCREKRAGTRRDPSAELEEVVAYTTVSHSTNNQRTEINQSEVTYSLVGNTAVENHVHLYATVDNLTTTKPTIDPTTDQQPTQPNNQPTTNPTTNQ
ncbi:hypothetical protein NL108_013686 [Boleophthalmus pectinirostris]|uniref:uncharacterized protein LOC110162210 n=1 Tax=Boleophthalmus pectinirostris TaxID=150288 RepID=UPI0024333619|nr:uncharacterized protein LOC110162210 [Boleophthalmus pectinirostris]KAJ0062477.1 hypothetical protein NL108_013686 [Boleophthalmus pectinirostris]